MAAGLSDSAAGQDKTVTLDHVKERVATIENMPQMGRGTVAICVVDIGTREVLVARNAHRIYAPASVLKVVTTAAALAKLGPDYRYTTTLQTAGKLEEGVLKGALVLEGSGDPTMGSWRFASEGFPPMTAWAQAAAKAVTDAGIRRIEGDLYIDASIFGDQIIPNDWAWDDIGNYYGAGAAGVNLHENLYHVDFQIPERQGDLTRIADIRPKQAGIRFHNRVTAGPPRSGDQAYIYAAPYTDVAVIRGTLPADAGKYTIKGGIMDPPLFTARTLADALKSAGVEVTGKATATFQTPRKPEGERTTVWTHQSPKLGDITYWLNKHSVNLYAEAFAKTLAVETDRPGTTEQGTRAVLDILGDLGVDTTGMILADGSGLSRRNAVSPRQVVDVLEKMALHPTYDVYLNSFPLAGVDDDPGGLSRVGVNTPAADNLRAKSGFISHARSYAGYVVDQSGRQLAFCMIANEFPSAGGGAIRNAFRELMVDLAHLKAE
ncbi:D-alanyl-D-alanine carboxypeptidase DacB precursor [Mucisphaera calidilacus]|uniref:D-alanyl-D-alanine carboxypeptidase DacB n=2 Tax=Mucisphaera calidilacus TaxID=2527982 RepID=A0A518C143_9BACT|nr:D-alanyl-D-alanine carboxypeptidase DacB precursor [Mucisphaera calidilacus]